MFTFMEWDNLPRSLIPRFRFATGLGLVPRGV